jgi:hypothetical protein
MDEHMDKILNVIFYINDLNSLEKVMQRLEYNYLKIVLFGNNEVSYLGFRLTPGIITPGKDKL